MGLKLLGMQGRGSGSAPDSVVPFPAAMGLCFVYLLLRRVVAGCLAPLTLKVFIFLQVL